MRRRRQRHPASKGRMQRQRRQQCVPLTCKGRAVGSAEVDGWLVPPLACMCRRAAGLAARPAEEGCLGRAPACAPVGNGSRPAPRHAAELQRARVSIEAHHGSLCYVPAGGAPSHRAPQSTTEHHRAASTTEPAPQSQHHRAPQSSQHHRAPQSQHHRANTPNP